MSNTTSTPKRGRPVKGSNPKKVELTAEQKRYTTVIEELNIHLSKKNERLEAISEKIKKLQAEQDVLSKEAANLSGAKKNLENILAGLPAPPEWQKFVEHVYHYHYHYYPNVPVYFGPWWYYTTGGTLTYPNWQTITTAPCYTSNGTYIWDNAYSGLSMSNAQTNYTFTSNAGSLPASVVTNNVNLDCSNSVSLASSSFNNSGVILGGTIPGVDATSGSGSLFCSCPATASAFTAMVVNTGLEPAGATHTPTLEQVKESEQFLTSIGFTATITN
jgi:hypothetical protein